MGVPPENFDRGVLSPNVDGDLGDENANCGPPLLKPADGVEDPALEYTLCNQIS